MLDVHPPLSPTHTWKDFFIHIATISIGLLIAMGLEQTVEAVHRHRERNQLQQDLNEEAHDNLGRGTHNLAHIDQDLAWLLLLRSRIDAARDGADKKSFQYPPQLHGFPGDPGSGDRTLSHDGAWNAAKQTGTLSLLPQGDLEFYSIFYRVMDVYTDSFTSLSLKWQKLTSFELQFERGDNAIAPEVSRVSHEQLDQYAAIVADLIKSALDTKRYLQIEIAFNESALGPKTRPDMGQYFLDHPDPVPAFDPNPIPSFDTTPMH